MDSQWIGIIWTNELKSVDCSEQILWNWIADANLFIFWLDKQGSSLIWTFLGHISETIHSEIQIIPMDSHWKAILMNCKSVDLFGIEQTLYNLTVNANSFTWSNGSHSYLLHCNWYWSVKALVLKSRLFQWIYIDLLKKFNSTRTHILYYGKHAISQWMLSFQKQSWDFSRPFFTQCGDRKMLLLIQSYL